MASKTQNQPAAALFSVWASLKYAPGRFKSAVLPFWGIASATSGGRELREIGADPNRGHHRNGGGAPVRRASGDNEILD